MQESLMMTKCMNVPSWISGEKFIESPWVSGSAKGSWVVAHRFQKTTDRKNMTEKCICGTKAVRSVAVKLAAGILMI